jgi:hypothetical protein
VAHEIRVKTLVSKMNLLEQLKAKFTGNAKPEHLRRGELGERAAKKHLQKLGLKFLAAKLI